MKREMTNGMGTENSDGGPVARVEGMSSCPRDVRVAICMVICAVIACLSLPSCMGREATEFNDQHRVGVYDDVTKATQYTFDKKKEARKLRDKLSVRGYEAEIRKSTRDGKVVYEVYVQENNVTPEDLRWPATGDPRIVYLGELKNRGSLENLQERLTGQKVEDRTSLRQIAYGAGYPSDSFLVQPYGIAVDDMGKVFVSDMNGIVLFDVKANRLERFMMTTRDATGGGPYSPFHYDPETPLLRPMGLAFGPEGVLYVADKGFKKILAFKDKKVVSEIGSDQGIESPFGMAIDRGRGRLYAAEPVQNAVYAYGLDGNFLFPISSSPEGSQGQRLGAPVSVALNSQGELFVVDQGGGRINVYSPDGDFERTIGSYGNYPGQFARPKGIAIDSDDNVYVSDVAFNNVQIFDAQGRLLLVIGSGGSGPGKFFLPVTLCIDSHDRLYVSDAGNDRVQVFQYLGSGQLSMSEKGEDE